MTITKNYHDFWYNSFHWTFRGTIMASPEYDITIQNQIAFFPRKSKTLSINFGIRLYTKKNLRNDQKQPLFNHPHSSLLSLLSIFFSMDFFFATQNISLVSSFSAHTTKVRSFFDVPLSFTQQCRMEAHTHFPSFSLQQPSTAVFSFSLQFLCFPFSSILSLLLFIVRPSQAR